MGLNAEHFLVDRPSTSINEATAALVPDPLNFGWDQLHADAEGSGRVMALALHPFVTGQAFRAKYLDQALEYVAGHPGVWLATSDEIAEHYARTAAEGKVRTTTEGKAP
ncbi:hypothetical protein ACQB60_22275 [Actinomycetota bacterium Odt1-20B]